MYDKSIYKIRHVEKFLRLTLLPVIFFKNVAKPKIQASASFLQYLVHVINKANNNCSIDLCYQKFIQNTTRFIVWTYQIKIQYKMKIPIKIPWSKNKSYSCDLKDLFKEHHEVCIISPK